MASAASLNHGECQLTDGSVEGQWRLPTLEELQGIGTDPPTTWGEYGFPPVTWTMPDLPFDSVQSSLYWSGTTDSSASNHAVCTNISSGYTNSIFKNGGGYYYYLWPVRADY